MAPNGRFPLLAIVPNLPKIQLVHRLQECRSASASHRMPPKRRDVAQLGLLAQCRHVGLRSDKGPDGHSTPQRLAQHEHIGHHIDGLEGMPVSRASQPALDLVEHKKGPDRIAPLPEGPGIIPGHGTDPRIALNRFGKHRCGALRDPIQYLNIAKGQVVHIRQEGHEGVPPMGRGGEAQCPHGRTVVPALQPEDLRSPRHPAHQLHGTLDRLGAAVHEIDRIKAVRAQRGKQPFGRQVLRILGVFAVHHHVQVTVNLLVQRCLDVRVTMAKGTDANPAHEVEQTFALVRDEPTTFSANDAVAERMGRRHGQPPGQEIVRFRHHSTGSTSNPNSSANTQVGFHRPGCHSGISPPLN